MVLINVNQCFRTFKTSKKLTQRCSGQQRLSGNRSTFNNIERIRIREGGTPIQVAKVSSNHVEVAVEVAIYQNDSCAVPNTVG